MIQIVVDFCGDYNAPEGMLKVTVLAKQEVKITNLDITDPVEYLDKYQPYKYGVIFRERLFVHSPEVLATLKLFLFRTHTHAEDTKQPQGISNPKDKKPAGTKGGSAGLSAGMIAAPIIDMDAVSELQTPVPVYLELFEEDTLKQVASGHNEVVLFNTVLHGEKSAPVNYYLQARFELREVPQAASQNEFTQGLHWGLSVQSTDVIVDYSDYSSSKGYTKR